MISYPRMYPQASLQWTPREDPRLDHTEQVPGTESRVCELGGGGGAWMFRAGAGSRSHRPQGLFSLMASIALLLVFLVVLRARLPNPYPLLLSSELPEITSRLSGHCVSFCTV